MMERADFPFFRKNPEYTYLDSGATTQKPDRVIEALSAYYQSGTAGVHRAFYQLGVDVTKAYEASRTAVARLLNASAGDIILTSGATESLNLTAASWGRAFLEPGDAILCTELEHHSNLLPWRMAAAQAGARVVMVPVTPQGDLDLVLLEELLAAKPKLLALTVVNNALGIVPPLLRIMDLAKRYGVMVALDAAQAGAHRPLDVADPACAFLVLSGHKMYAPEGSGALYVNPSIRDRLEPWKTGGVMVARVTASAQEWAEAPTCFEAGTPNTGPQIAFGTALELLMEEGLEMIQNREAGLLAECTAMLASLSGVTLIGAPQERCGAVGFNLDGVHPHDLAQFLDSRQIAVRSGFHCAQPLFQALGLSGGACRVSFGSYNGPEDIERLRAGLVEAKGFFSDGK